MKLALIMSGSFVIGIAQTSASGGTELIIKVDIRDICCADG
jgi:hypothetical protein